MRTSKTQQAKSHRLILRTAVDLMTEHGYDGTTMKHIARTAGLGDATIYKYFPTKEKLVMGYFEQAMGDAVAQLQKTKDLEGFTLQERMQLLVDTVLEQLLPDREFVAIAHQLAHRMPLAFAGSNLPGKEVLKAAFMDMLTAAEASGEIPACSFKSALSALLADGVYAMLAHWLRDTSEQFGNTTQLVDMALGVLVLALQSGLVERLMALGSFVLRSQLSRWMQDGQGWLGVLQNARRTLHPQANHQGT
jgi:TetR/AcrR family transcriptional regulator, regulator of autoinduction and epiphytic fitness